MGDRCTVSIRFGGKITTAQAEQLIERLKRYDFRFNVDEEPNLDNLDEDFFAEEIDYANIDEVTDYCQAEKIAYDKWNGAGGDYGEGMERFDGEVHRAAACADGGPMLLYSQLLEIDTLASAMGALIEEARWWARSLGNLEIIP